jgi:hypothetical protein
MSYKIIYLRKIQHAAPITDGRRRRSELARLWSPRVASLGFRKKSELNGNGGTTELEPDDTSTIAASCLFREGPVKPTRRGD